MLSAIDQFTKEQLTRIEIPSFSVLLNCIAITIRQQKGRTGIDRNRKENATKIGSHFSNRELDTLIRSKVNNKFMNH